MEDKYIMEGPPALEVPPISLGQYILEKLVIHGDKVALVDAATGESITYYEAYCRSIALAQNMAALGIRRGDSVGISSENHINFVLPVLATAYLGAAMAPYNPLYTSGELLHTMSLSRPRIVFASSMSLQRVLEVCKSVDSVRDVVLITDNPPPGTTGFLRLSELLTPLAPISSFRPTTVDPAVDTAAILCSSGTTGLPKGVELTHTNMMQFIAVTTYCNELDTKEEVFPGFVPFFHGYGFGILYVSLSMGIKIVSLPRFEEKSFLKSIQDHKITALFLVPPVMVFLGKHALVDQYDLSSVRRITCGAAPLSREAQSAVEKRLNVNDIRQGYGMTEVSVLATACHVPGLNKTGCSGQLVPGFKAKILDVETMTVIPPNKQGIICLKGPMIMKGYRLNPKETADMVDKDGWLITGDIGYFDEDGCLFIVDRVKELIKYKAYQVPPAELEAILITHPEIRDAGVIGKPDDDAGELPFAFVVRQPNSKITEKEVLEYVAARVSPQKRLRGGVRFVDEIPKNPSGKILRRVLRSKL